jgi:hypothetical protein
MKLTYFILAAAGLAMCLYFKDYFGAGLIIGMGLVVAQS